LAENPDHSVGRCAVIAQDFVDFFREKIAHGSLNQIWLLKYAARRGLLANDLLDLGPLIEEEPEVPHGIWGTCSFPYGGDYGAVPFGNVQFAQDLAKPLALLWILDFSRDATVITKRHQHEVTPGETEVRRNPRPFRPNRSFGYLDNYVRPDRVNVRYIFCGDPFSRPLVRGPIDFFNSAVERGGNGIPKMKKGVFFEADIHEHRLQPNFDVLDFPLGNAADDIARVFTLDAVFLEPSIFQQRDARLEFFHAEYEFVPGLARRKPYN